MSNRQIEVFLACLLGLVWGAPVAHAQFSRPNGTAAQAASPQIARPGPTTLDRGQPTASRKGGFIQQLRALPDASVQILQEAEERQFRLPPRSDQVRRVQANVRAPNEPPQATFNLPAQPTGRSTLQRTHESPWIERMNQRGPSQSPAPRNLQLTQPRDRNIPNYSGVGQSLRGEQTRFTDLPSEVEEPAEDRIDYQENTAGDQLDAPAGFLLGELSEGSPALDTREPAQPRVELELGDQELSDQEFIEKYESKLQSEAESPQPAQRSPELLKGHQRMSTTRLPQYQPTQESPVVSVDEVPRDGKFDAMTVASLQKAPRVSRVPLPRPSAQSSLSSRQMDPAADSQKTSDENASADEPQLPSPGTTDSVATQSDVEATRTEAGLEASLDDSTDLPTPRIQASPASLAPQLGGGRISNATLQSQLKDDIGPEAAPKIETKNSSPDLAFGLPANPTLPSASQSLPQLQPQEQAAAQPPLPPLPSATLSSESKDPANEVSSTSDQPVLSGRKSISDESVTQETTGLPSSDPTSLGLALPTTAPSQSTAPQSTVRQPATPSLHMPRLVTEGTQSKLRAEPTDTAEQRLKMEAPHIVVVLNGPGDLPVGTPAEYEIVVRNDDKIDLRGLILRLDVPAGVKVNAIKPSHGEFEMEKAADGLTMLTWAFEHLPAGQQATAPMQLVASSAKNFAVAMEWTLMPISGSSSLDVRAPRLELALDGPAEVRFGEPNAYRLHIRNPGTALAKQIAVRLSAEPFGSSTAEIEQIAPGEEEVIEVELTFNERGAINIAALAEELTGLTSKTAIAVNVRQAIVESEISASELVYYGSPSECHVRLTNSGDADAQDLRASLQLPDGAGLISAPPGAVMNDRELVWSVGKLPAGNSAEFTVQLTLTGEGANKLQFQCSGPSIAATTAQAITQVQSVTDLKLFVNDPIGPAPVGSEVVYELSLTNRGSKAATNVKVVTQFSDGIEPVRGEGQAARVVPGQALFEALPRLAAGETVNLKVFAKASASGTHRFRVEVRSDESDVRLVQEESTQYLESVSRMAAPMSGSSTLR